MTGLFGWVIDHATEQLWIFCTVDGKLLITPLLQYVDCPPKDCHTNIAIDGPWCLHRPMKLLLLDLLRLVLLAKDLMLVGLMSKLWSLPSMLGITNGRWVRTRSSQSGAVVCCRLGYMQQAVSWWWEIGEGIGVDFPIRPCGAREAFAGAGEY